MRTRSQEQIIDDLILRTRPLIQREAHRTCKEVPDWNQITLVVETCRQINADPDIYLRTVNTAEQIRLINTLSDMLLSLRVQVDRLEQQEVRHAAQARF